MLPPSNLWPSAGVVPVMRMAADDHASFTEWATGRRRHLLRTAVLLTGDHARAEDLVQDALTKVALRWSRLHDGHPDAYARQVIVRDNISRWRRTRLEVVGAFDDSRRTPSGEGASDRRLVLLDALRRLTERQRTVLVLRYLEDLSEAETADVMGVSTGTVKSTTHLALRRMREAAPELADLMHATPGESR